MKIVIDIPERYYDILKKKTAKTANEPKTKLTFMGTLCEAVGKGVPLPKGQWIERVERDDWDDSEEVWYECDQCHVGSERVSKYCPSCGAKMGESEVSDAVSN